MLACKEKPNRKSMVIFADLWIFAKEEKVAIHKFDPKSNPDQPYTMIPNSTAQDAKLSYAAKGLLLELQSRPADWKFYVTALAETGACSPEKVRIILKELEDAGYLTVLKKCRSHSGKWSGTDYQVFANRTSETIQKSSPNHVFPDTVKPYAAKPYTEKTALQIQEYTKARKNKGEVVPPPPPSSPPSRTPKPKRVMASACNLTEEQKATLAQTYGADTLEATIRRMEDYIAAHGRPGYADWSAAIRNWMARETNYKPKGPAQQINSPPQPKPTSPAEQARFRENSELLGLSRKVYGKELTTAQGIMVNLGSDDMVWMQFPDGRTNGLHISDKDFKLKICNTLVASGKDLSKLNGHMPARS